MSRAASFLLPTLVGLLFLIGWEWLVRANDIPPYLLPGPMAIARAMVEDWPNLWASLRSPSASPSLPWRPR